MCSSLYCPFKHHSAVEYPITGFLLSVHVQQVIKESGDVIPGLVGRVQSGKRVNAGSAVALMLEAKYDETRNLTIGIADETDSFLSFINPEERTTRARKNSASSRQLLGGFLVIAWGLAVAAWVGAL